MPNTFVFDFDSSSVVDVFSCFFFFWFVFIVGSIFLFGQISMVLSQNICARGTFVESSPQRVEVSTTRALSAAMFLGSAPLLARHSEISYSTLTTGMHKYNLFLLEVQL